MKLPTDLTKKQQKVLKIIIGYIESEGVSPELKEIAKDYGTHALNTIINHLHALERKGYITRRYRTHRGIKLTLPED